MKNKFYMKTFREKTLMEGETNLNIIKNKNTLLYQKSFIVT